MVLSEFSDEQVPGPYSNPLVNLPRIRSLATQFSMVPVVQSAIACGVVGGAAAVLWQFPVVRKVARVLNLRRHFAGRKGVEVAPRSARASCRCRAGLGPRCAEERRIAGAEVVPSRCWRGRTALPR